MDLNDFTTDDWYTVLEGVTAGAGIVSMSDVSGPIGLLKEAMASTESLREGASQSPFSTALRTHLFGATKEQEEALMKAAQAKQAALKGQSQTKEQAMQAALDTIRNSVKFVEDKAGADAAAEYKQIILQGAQKAAEAGKEGGFFGIGGKLVSDAEVGALAQIKAALNL